MRFQLPSNGAFQSPAGRVLLPLFLAVVFAWTSMASAQGQLRNALPNLGNQGQGGLIQGNIQGSLLQGNLQGNIQINPGAIPGLLNQGAMNPGTINPGTMNQGTWPNPNQGTYPPNPGTYPRNPGTYPVPVNPGFNPGTYPAPVNPGFNPGTYPTPVNPGVNPGTYPTPVNPGFNPGTYPAPVNPGVNPGTYPTPVNPGFNPGTYPTPVNPGINPGTYPTPGNPNPWPNPNPNPVNPNPNPVNPSPNPVNPNPWPNPNPNPVSPNPNPVNPSPNPVNPNPANPANPNPRTQAPRKIHLIICGQSGTTNAAFNSTIEVNLTRFTDPAIGLLSMVGPQFTASETILEGSNCTSDRILSTINNLNVNPNDAIFFYYTGHGANWNNRHYFQLRGNANGGNDLPRSDVEQALKRKNVRLAVLISESCNRESRANVAMASPSAGTFNTLTQLEDLLLNYRGFVNVNSADDGQLGWGTRVEGGFYSMKFGQMLANFAPGNGWNHDLRMIGEAANQKFQQFRQEKINAGVAPPELVNQQSMTPKIYEMQVQRDPSNINPGTRQIPPGSP
ncbi:MAG: hypothetical protein AAF456_20285 [Planctomycetota bacterium]